jgi:hypothetical protein
MEQVADLASLGTGANAQAIDTTIPQAMTYEVTKLHIISNVVIPEVGMMFQSEKDVYEMYNTYASNIGFSIKKSDIK